MRAALWLVGPVALLGAATSQVLYFRLLLVPSITDRMYCSRTVRWCFTDSSKRSAGALHSLPFEAEYGKSAASRLPSRISAWHSSSSRASP